MSKKKKIIFWICIAAAALAAGFIVFYITTETIQKKKLEEVQDTVEEETAPVEEVVEEPKPIKEPEPEVVEEPFVSPIDFEKLKSINTDIYAWFKITDTETDYPILQREGDINFYLEHAYDGSYSIAGSLFTESVNAKDFTDFNTIIYGHNMRDGSFFGDLYLYKDEEYLKNHREIIIYTPEATLTYTVFATAIYNNSLLSVAFDYSTAEGRQEFLDSIYACSGYGDHVLDDIEVGTEDRIITLSTCTGDYSTRFLVEAVLTNIEN